MVAKAKVDMIEEHACQKLYEGVIPLMYKDSKSKGSSRLATEFLRNLSPQQWRMLLVYVREKHGTRAYGDLLRAYYPKSSEGSNEDFPKTQPASLC